ncbi:Uncharacterised protein [Mycobacteroides abscessus subsp. abscessus]|nr:Uncharacterised protein [Mycobacteroides abscessus subsp. abscessus]
MPVLQGVVVPIGIVLDNRGVGETARAIDQILCDIGNPRGRKHAVEQLADGALQKTAQTGDERHRSRQVKAGGLFDALYPLLKDLQRTEFRQPWQRRVKALGRVVRDRRG